MIRVDNLQKRYRGGDAPVLNGVSFEVPEGGLAAVLGPSGAGKSTLLRCLIGLEIFDRGTVAVEGVELHGVLGNGVDWGRSVRMLRSRMGLVFQTLELFPHLTALENCTLAPVMVKRAAPKDADQRARTLLYDLGLEEKCAEYPEHLSGGQRQRVAIARALAMEPRVLLYDEPTSALDPAFKREVVQTVRRVKETGVTQVLVTHDVQLAREVAERVFILDQGQIVESGDPRQVLDSPSHESTRRLLATAAA